MMQAHDMANSWHGSKIQLSTMSTRYEKWERGKTQEVSRRRERWQRTGAIERKMLKNWFSPSRFLIIFLV